MFCEKAAACLKEEKNDDAVKFYKKAKTSLESLLKFDENKYNHPVYELKKTRNREKIRRVRIKKEKSSK